MMFSKRRNALASGAIVASIALSGARAQSADDARFLTAVTSPKIVEVGVEFPVGNVSPEDGDGFAVMSFKTGPNLFSYDFTASCFVQDWSLPTNDCKYIEYERNGPVGESWTGQTGKTYSELLGTITGLDPNETYDCFIFTKSPQGKEKCKYVGSTDIGCFEAEPVSIEGTSGPVVFGDLDTEGGTVVPVGPFYGLEIDYEMLGVGYPPIEPGLDRSLGFLCLEGPYAACPSSWVNDDLLTLSFPDYPATTGGSLVFANDTFVGSDAIAGTNTTPDQGAPVVANTLYSCFSVLEDSCSPSSRPVCSDPVELISPPALAIPAGTDGISPVLFVSDAAGNVTAACDRTYAVDVEGDALEVFNMWTCTGAGAWFPIVCDGTPQERTITGFSDQDIECILWQGQGELGAGCHPDSPDQCNWQASGDEAFYSPLWSETVTAFSG